MTPKEQRSALVVLALFLPSLLALFWSAHLGGGAPRPGALRAFTAGGQPHAAFFFDDALHLLDARGERLARQPLAELALSLEPTDMDWTVAPGGRLQAWFFEDTVPRLVRCELQPAPLRLHDCAQVLSGPQLKLEPASEAVHIAVDASGQRVFIADAKGHGVRAFSLQGQGTLLAEGGRGELFFPNRLRLVGDQLVVADNDHHRLAWLDVAGERPGFQVVRTLDVAAHPQAAGGGRKAADFAFGLGPDGAPTGLWLLAVAQGQQQGRVLTYGPGLAPRGAASLGGHGDPLVIDAFGGSLLVADFAGIALYRLGADGSYLGDFGSGAFAHELAAGRARWRAAEHWKYAGWAGLALTLLAGFALAWRHSERPGQRQAQEAFAWLDGMRGSVPLDPLELRSGAWYFWWQLRMVGLALLAPLALVLGMAWLAPYEIPPRFAPADRGWLLAAGAVAWLAGVLAGAWVAWQQGRRTLWLGEGRIEVRSGGRTLARTRPDQLLASARHLLVGHLALPYRTGGTSRPGRWIYDQHPLGRYVLAHLAPHQRLTDAELARTRLRRLPRWQWVAMALPLVLAVAFVLWQWGR